MNGLKNKDLTNQQRWRRSPKGKLWEKTNKDKVRNTPEGYLYYKWLDMKRRVEGRTNQNDSALNQELCNKDVFIETFTKDPNFIRIWTTWLAEGKPRKLSPSVDRIDSSLGYSLENIQILTTSENCKKAAVERWKVKKGAN